MPPQGRPALLRYTPLIGAFFALAGVAALLTRQFLIGGALLSVGAAFLVYGRDTRPWPMIPRWKRLTTLSLVFLGGALLVLSLVFGG